MKRLAATLALLPSLAFGEGLIVEKPMVPLAPSGAAAHAAFMILSNPGDESKYLIGASAEGYMMAHIHKSEEIDGVATMSSIDMIEIGAGESVTLAHGGLHIMLMKPMAPKAEGDVVTLTLEFVDGTSQDVTAPVMKTMHGM